MASHQSRAQSHWSMIRSSSLHSRSRHEDMPVYNLRPPKFAPKALAAVVEVCPPTPRGPPLSVLNIALMYVGRAIKNFRFFKVNEYTSKLSKLKELYLMSPYVRFIFSCLTPNVILSHPLLCRTGSVSSPLYCVPLWAELHPLTTPTTSAVSQSTQWSTCYLQNRLDKG